MKDIFVTVDVKLNSTKLKTLMLLFSWFSETEVLLTNLLYTILHFLTSCTERKAHYYNKTPSNINRLLNTEHTFHLHSKHKNLDYPTFLWFS